MGSSEDSEGHYHPSWQIFLSEIPAHTMRCTPTEAFPFTAKYDKSHLHIHTKYGYTSHNESYPVVGDPSFTEIDQNDFEHC